MHLRCGRTHEVGKGSAAHHQVLDGALAGVGCVLEDETQEGDLRSRQRHTSCEGLRSSPGAAMVRQYEEISTQSQS